MTMHHRTDAAPSDAGRRALLHRSLGLGLSVGVSAASLSACQASGERNLSLRTLGEAMTEVQTLAGAAQRVSQARWSWAQTLVHAAQSIEFSMQGFPQAKPRWFQTLVGAPALQVFQWRGRLTHDRTEPIPGAPSLDPAPSEAEALARLQAAVQAFLGWAGPLRPHFAYGELDKASYEQAHAMHLAHHLSQFQVGPAAG